MIALKFCRISFQKMRKETINSFFIHKHRFESARSLRSHCKYQKRNACEVCSHQFCIASELALHRQQGCEGLIEINSTVGVDSKATAVDLYLEYHGDSDENLTIGDEFDANGSDANQIDPKDVDHQDENSAKENGNRTDRDSVSFEIDHKPSFPKKRKTGQSKRSRGRIKCADCNQTFSNKRCLIAHQRYFHERQFECWLCHKE